MAAPSRYLPPFLAGERETVTGDGLRALFFFSSYAVRSLGFLGVAGYVVLEGEYYLEGLFERERGISGGG